MQSTSEAATRRVRRTASSIGHRTPHEKETRLAVRADLTAQSLSLDRLARAKLLPASMIGTANLKVRPLKLALLVDPDSPSQVRQAIRLACSLWGGMFFPIIPLHKRMPASWRDGPVRAPSAEAVIKGYVEAFDPDLLVQFAAVLPGYVGDFRLRVVTPQEVYGDRGGERVMEPSVGIGVIDVMTDIFEECFKYKAKFPEKVIIPRLPRKFGLFWASVFGEYDDRVASAILDEHSEALDVAQPDLSLDDYLDLTDTSVLFPRRITAWGLSSHGGLGFGSPACVYFMDAANVEDVIDYWNLRATGRNVVPLPKQFAEAETFKESVQRFLIAQRRPWRHDPQHFHTASIVRSRHSTMEEMTVFAKTLCLPKEGAGESARRYFGLQHWYPRIWEEWARGHDGGVANIYGEGEAAIEISSAADLEMRVKPLLPTFKKGPWFSSHGVCANEFDLRLYGADEHLAEVFPKASGEKLIRAISGFAGNDEWRIGRHGLVHLVSRTYAISRTVPSSESVFFAWLADHGWKAELSPPGVLAKQIFKRLSGFPRYIADRTILGMIEYMNGGAVGKNGEQLAGSRLPIEREISAGELKAKLSGRAGKGTLYDDFVAKGIFRLGLRTKCPNCQRNSWFPVSGLRESIECPKCLGTFAAAGNIETSSSWFYRTAGPFSVPNYADGAFAVLIALDAVSDRMRGSLRTTAVPSFTATASGKASLEADFAMFWRESARGDDREGLLFGESKTYGLFESKDIERMRSLAKTFPGSVLVFSTLRESLSPQEIKALARLAKEGRKYWKAERPINPVLILTGTELLKWERPPMCWSEAQQKRFANVYDLLSLCDATQQIYLGLPSWQEDWRKTWDRKRARRDAKVVSD
jgi:hypothetical protein